MPDDQYDTAPEYDVEPDYKTIDDLPDPGHQRGPLGAYAQQFESDTLNYLQKTVEDSLYVNLMLQIQNANLTNGAKNRLRLLADAFVKPFEYVVTNLRTNNEIRRIQNDLRMAVADAKIGLRRIDHTNEFISIVGIMESHLTGAKLTRARGGFERKEQQTQRGMMGSTFEHKQPEQKPQSGISRLVGVGGRR